MIGCARCCAFWQGNLRFPICLCVFFSVCFDVVSFKAAKTNIAVFFFSTFCDTSEEFISFVCSVYVGAVCVFCVCVLIIAFSHQISTKRGQVGTVPINLLTIDHPEPAPPPYVKHRTLLVSTFLIKLCALHPKMLGILLWLPPFILSFLIDKKQSQYSDIQKKSQYWECCLIAFRRQIWDPESVWHGHISAHKLNCDQAKDDTLHTFSFFTSGAQSNFTALPHSRWA